MNWVSAVERKGTTQEMLCIQKHGLIVLTDNMTEWQPWVCRMRDERTF